MVILHNWLKILRFMHIMAALVTGLFSFVPSFNTIGIGFFVLSGGYYDTDLSQLIGNYSYGGLLLLIGYVVCLTGWTFAAIMFSIAICLQHKRNYKLCKVLAYVLCILPPHGTVLGVLTLITLYSKSVRKLFEQSVNEPMAASGEASVG